MLETMLKENYGPKRCFYLYKGVVDDIQDDINHSSVGLVVFWNQVV